MARIDTDKYKHPLISDTQDGQDVLGIFDAENIDYIYEQILYRNRLLLEANGETFQIWRKKLSGDPCDNPSCPFSKDYKQSPNQSCPRCVGSGYIGGYDYIGETLIRVSAPTASSVFKMEEGGILKISNPKTWTFPEPSIRNFDILIALDRPMTFENLNKNDIEIDRGSGDFDTIEDANVIRIVKISNNANSSIDYEKDIDYVLSNNTVLWKTSNRPAEDDTYFISYIISLEYIRRFEVTESNEIVWRAKITHQELSLSELSINHPNYRLLEINPYDDTRRNYPFPTDQWYERE